MILSEDAGTCVWAPRLLVVVSFKTFLMILLFFLATFTEGLVANVSRIRR
jgi:hypothetical protein